MLRRLAFDKSWLAYYSELMGKWTRSASCRQDAEDAAQDSVARMLADDRAAILDPSAYLFRSTTNRYISEQRRQSRQMCVSLEDLSDAEHPALADPDAWARASQLADALECALLDLPVKKRQAYMYHRLEGYSQREIAEKLGLSLNTIERYIMDATQEIRHRLQVYCPKQRDKA